ncbi:MAG: glycosylase [Phycisphaerae bacterium]|nr:glycosylase [Phycisphaerae bacterium]MDW8262064.1 hypothetical protein [Phycisphaerales bacterium]
MSQITPAEMRQVFEECKTPHKFGVILRGDDGKPVDCPSVFRFHDAWYMMYACMNQVGYETHLARSDDLLHWTPLGKILPFRDQENAWDRWQADGGIALHDPVWGGTGQLQAYDGKYWLSYIGGALQGYEPDPLSIGIAWTSDPTQPIEWHRLESNPVLSPSDPDVRAFEKKTLYKSNVLWDRQSSLGAPFVMFYNGKQDGPRGWERIGMAISHDMVRWKRFGSGPVIDNEIGISGDPQIVRIGDLWVMFYFGHVWKPKAFDTFACSRDLVHWVKWEGPHLVEPSEPWDSTFAHKPWLLKHDGVVYHFYCAVAGKERTIALATSKPL